MKSAVVFVLCVCFVALSKQAAKKKGSSSGGKTTPKPKPPIQLTGAAIYEHEERVTTLTELPCSSADTVVSIKAVKSNTRNKPPCAICFQVYPGAYDNYELRFLPLADVDYSVDQSYSIKMDCRDQENLVLMQLSVVVRVEPNTPPYFLLLHEKTSKTVQELTQSGLEVNGCQDDDQMSGDFLTYTLVAMEPYSVHFTLTREGLIKVSGDLRGECRSPITFVINCEDRFEHLAPEPYTMQLTIEDGNKAPAINGLNRVVEVPEDEADASSLATLGVLEGGDNPFCLLAAEPPQALQFFDLEMSGTSGDIKVKTRLNYEQAETRNTNLTVTCSDGFCASSVAYLYVMVTDVNEPLTLLPNDVTLTVYEGSVSVDPNWTPIDEDEGDDPVYNIVDGNTYGRFEIEPTTGVITSILTYDIDENAMPTRDTIVVQAQDEGGHVSTSTVTLTVVDLNDHRPEWTSDSVALVTDNCTYTVGAVIGNLTATDGDSSFQGNNIITYSGSDGHVSVHTDGYIYVESELIVGTTYVVEAFASDSGQEPGPLTSAKPATVIVDVTDCPPTTPTTTTTESTTLGFNAKAASKDNWFWIAMSSLLLLMLLSAAGTVAWKSCSPVRRAGRKVSMCSKELCGDCCSPRRFSTRKVRPAEIENTRDFYASSNSAGSSVVLTSLPLFKTRSSLDMGQSLRNAPKNGNSGFWQERFTDDGYMSKEPSRNHTPSPAPVEGSGPLFVESWRLRAIVD